MDEHSHFLEVVKILFPYLVVFGAFILSVIIVTKYKVPKLEVDLKFVKDAMDDLKKEQNNMATKEELLKSFLDPSGNPRFQPLARCQEIRDFCGRQNNLLIKHLGDKMDGVGDRMVGALNELDRKRTEQQQENAKKFDDLADAVKETNESLGKTNEKLIAVAQRVEVNSNIINSGGLNNKYDMDDLAEKLVERISRELKT